MKTLIKNIFGRISYNIGILLIKKRNTSFKSILVLAPHPDDEIIGLGGLVLQTLKNNGQVYITYLTDGKNSGASANKNEIKKQRIRLSEQVINKLNINPENISRLHLPDGEIPFSKKNGFNETVDIIKNQIESIKPDAVFATAKSDYWPFDHVACSQIAQIAIENSKHKTELWFYYNGELAYKIENPTTTFDIPMYYNLAVETYDWNPPHADGKGMEGLTKDERSTQYQWIRTWKLEDK